MAYFSVIVPVYNRRDEVRDLLASLAAQTMKDFEVIIVEDGSTDPCGDIVDEYSDRLKLLVEQWRRDFGQGELPFYFVQIAPYIYGSVLQWFQGQCPQCAPSPPPRPSLSLER